MTSVLLIALGALFVAIGATVTQRRPGGPSALAETLARVIFVVIGALIWRLA